MPYPKWIMTLFHFHYDVVEGKPFIWTSDGDRVRIQLHLLTTFLKGVGQLWSLDDSWSPLGILTGNSASISESNWSQENISVSRFILVTVLLNIFMPSKWSKWGCSDQVFLRVVYIEL